MPVASLARGPRAGENNMSPLQREHMQTPTCAARTLNKRRHTAGFPSGIIRYNWNDTEKFSMAPAQG